jgi:hypothetical protein
MEKEKLLNYRGQAPIRFLNDFNAGLLTADEYKLIRDLDKAGAWDSIDEYINDAEPESPESLPKESPEPISEEAAPPKRKSIPLRTDVKIARNFFATPNEVIDVIAPLQTPAEECVYRRLFRWSYGWQRNHCRASIPLLLSTSKMKSRNTVRKALRGLLDKGHIAEYIDDSGRIDINNNGTLYIVHLPEEIDGLPERGSNSEGGLKYKGGAKNNPGQKINPLDETVDTSTSSEGGLKNDRLKNEGGSNFRRVKINPPDGQKMTGQKMNPPAQTPANKGSTKGGSNFEGSKNGPIKNSIKNNSKNTLSPDSIVHLFYTGIGQEDISQDEREKALSIIEKLQKKGKRKYTLEEIAFAVKWIHENRTEPLRTFGIMPSIMHQAMRAKKAADKVQAETARVTAAEEERRRLEGEIQEMRSKMSEDELNELGEKALKEIRESGEFKEAFITEHLITAKENEILRRG